MARDASALQEAADEICRVAEQHPDALLGVVGPTATGKTELAVQVAERLGAEIVSADSVQIYRAFDAGSGKPTKAELRVPHHLIDALDPLDAVDAAAYAKRAESALAEIASRGRRAIVCGGTYLWVKALVSGLAEAPPADAAIRARHRAIVAAEGRDALHAMLRAVDPQSAERLHPNDVVRVSRAIEIFEQSGEQMSALHASHAFQSPRHDARLFALSTDPAELTGRITGRVDAWLKEGWVEEVERLLARGFGDARAMGSVGYRQVREHVEGRLPGADLRDAIVRATRVFARRQRTWLNRETLRWVG